MKLFLNVSETLYALGAFLMRLVIGTAFVLHGWPKIQNPFNWMGPESSIPGFFQALAAIAEFGGGLAWVLGLLTPLASFGLLCTMAVAVWTHASKGDPFVGRGGSYELAAVYLVFSILLLLAGPGLISIDAWISGKRQSVSK